MKLFKDGEFIGEFTDRDEAKSFLMRNYNQWNLPDDMPPTAEECEAHYRSTGKWTNWFDVMGVTAAYHKNEEVYMDIPITIICKEHGEFTMTPQKHLEGHGCPECDAEKLLNKI